MRHKNVTYFPAKGGVAARAASWHKVENYPNTALYVKMYRKHTHGTKLSKTAKENTRAAEEKQRLLVEQERIAAIAKKEREERGDEEAEGDGLVVGLHLESGWGWGGALLVLEARGLEA